MPATIKKMGKVGAPQFGALTKASPVKKRNIPAILAIVLAGVAVILYLKSRNNATVSTGPAVSINGGSAPDQSTIDNLTASVLALQGQVANNSTVPGGGASTPQASVWGQLPSTPWNDAWDANQSLMSSDWLAWMRKFTPEQLDPSLGGTRGLSNAQTYTGTTSANGGSTAGGPTPRQNGVPVGAFPSGTVGWSLTPAESTALLGGGKPIDFVKEAKSVGASAPAYGTPAADQWTNMLYDRLAILSNYYDNQYTGTSPSAGNASLGKAIQTTQQQIYNWVNGANPNNGVPIPYNQFIANEGVYTTRSSAVQALIRGAAPSGAPMATSLGVYDPNSGTAGYIASLAGGTAEGSVGGGSSNGAPHLTLAQYDAANRAGIISRGTGNVSTAGINATVRDNYAKYLKGAAS